MAGCASPPCYREHWLAWLAVLLCSIGTWPNTARSQCELDVSVIDPSDGTSSDEAGYSVAGSGNTVVIGARGDDDNGSNSGSAYILTATDSGWMEDQKLLAADGAPEDMFGNSVAVSGDTAVIGAYGNGDEGGAYVFRFDGLRWVEEQKLIPQDGAFGDNFGYAVAVSGDVALIGAYGVDDGGTSSGAAYVFRFDGSAWREEQKLSASDGEAYDFFGVAVGLSGDVAVVGAYLADEGGANAGSAYAFRFDGSTWSEEQKLVASDGAADDRFGGSVAVSGDTIAVGAAQHDFQGINSGTAYVYRFNSSGWIEEAKLLPADGSAYDSFGVSVAVSGGIALVGAHLNDADGMSDAGAAYLFGVEGSTWGEIDKLVAPDGWYWDYFGFSVALSDGVMVAGAIQDDNKGNNSGSVYFFEGQCSSSGCRFDEECDDNDPCTVNLCVDGDCTSAPPPDFDGSGTVDLEDFGFAHTCIGSPTDGNIEAPCFCVDLNGDGSVDLRDLALFQIAFRK